MRTQRDSTAPGGTPGSTGQDSGESPGRGGGRTGDRSGRPGGGRTARSEERREEILRATMEVIGERGYRGTSLAAVAERAGLTQAGLLHHFPNKEQLLVGVLEARDRWDVTRGGLQHWTLDHLDQLVEVNAARRSLVQTFTVLAAGSVADEDPSGAYFAERYERVRTELAAALRSEFGERIPAGLTPEQAAPLLVAAMDGLQLQWLHAPDRVDMPESFRDFLTLLRATGPRDAAGSG